VIIIKAILEPFCYHLSAKGAHNMNIFVRLFYAFCMFYMAYGWIGRDNIILEKHTSSRRANLGASTLDTIHFYLGDAGGALLLSLAGIAILWSIIGFRGIPKFHRLGSDNGKSGRLAIDDTEGVGSQLPLLTPTPPAPSFGRRRVSVTSTYPPAGKSSSHYPEELNVTVQADVRYIMESRDPTLWHLAAMAALAYRGDPHGLLPWLIKQAGLDRATAGWVFLWAEGWRYLEGETKWPDFNHFTSEQMMDFFEQICERSERMGFSNDEIGLDGDFDEGRQLSVAAINKGVPSGIIAPHALVKRPFPKPNDKCHYDLVDGDLIFDVWSQHIPGRK
jgi:hypothetical protein